MKYKYKEAQSFADSGRPEKARKVETIFDEMQKATATFISLNDENMKDTEALIAYAETILSK